MHDKKKGREAAKRNDKNKYILNQMQMHFKRHRIIIKLIPYVISIMCTMYANLCSYLTFLQHK